jgi:hypothetical protein
MEDMTTMERDMALKNVAQNDKGTVIVVSILAGGAGKSIVHSSNNEIHLYLLSLSHLGIKLLF